MVIFQTILLILIIILLLYIFIALFFVHMKNKNHSRYNNANLNVDRENTRQILSSNRVKEQTHDVYNVGITNFGEPQIHYSRESVIESMGEKKMPMNQENNESYSLVSSDIEKIASCLVFLVLVGSIPLHILSNDSIEHDDSKILIICKSFLQYNYDFLDGIDDLMDLQEINRE